MIFLSVERWHNFHNFLSPEDSHEEGFVTDYSFVGYRDAFTTLSKIYGGAFCKNCKRKIFAKYFIMYLWQVLNTSHCVESVQIRSFFWSVFSRIRTEYGEILHISPYSVRMWENTDQKKLRICTLFTQCLCYRIKSNCQISRIRNSH